MASNLTGWLDYDRPLLHLLTRCERIDYFEKRVRLVVVNPLSRVLRNDVHISPDSSALLVFGVALCCAIEATGKFLVGGCPDNASRFYAFLAKYMAPEYQSQWINSKKYSEVLWRHFRNGLAHGFAVSHGGFEGGGNEPYFAVRSIAGHDSLLVNPYLFFNDYVDGLDRYLSDLRGCQPSDQLAQDFDKVFELVFIQGK